MELQKKDYQEFVNRGRYMKETNPNTWKKWENGEIKYVPVNHDVYLNQEKTILLTD